jgi:hypothetical protein
VLENDLTRCPEGGYVRDLMFEAMYWQKSIYRNQNINR